jgi:dTDP-4-dehydrorhamnose reductase
MDRFLVVGGDGLIGGALGKYLEERGKSICRTTHPAGAIDGALGLDLSDLDHYPATMGELESLALTGRLTVFLAAAISGYDQCENNPIASRRINVTNTHLLTQRLLAQGAFVVFLSSNAVFSGEQVPTEDSPRDPRSEYGRQKADAEICLLEAASGARAGSGVAVVRLTKVLSATQKLMHDWIGTLRGNGYIDAATDLSFSPISVHYVVQCLVQIGENRQSGVYHLSGPGDASYFEFATMLAKLLGVPGRNVRSIEIRGRLGVVPAPKFSYLDMAKTIKHIGICPQTMQSVAGDLLEAGFLS